MAEVVQEKSRGLKFAEQQLLRHGWEHGKGLGRAENGISEAIKVKVKCDKGGVGHKAGEQFTFHWWDHVFNKASSSLQVESDQSGVKVTKTAEEEDGMISNKKPRKAALAKEKLYGCFVKAATLLSGQEQPEPKPSSKSDDGSSSSEEEEEEGEEDQRLDLSSTTKLTDCDLMKACGGRTAHKGARHGLTMSAKLARLEQQEAEFMAKYGKKSQTGSASPVCVTQSPPTSQEERRPKKAKKKRSDDEVTDGPETDVQPKKKKKKKRSAEEEEEDAEGRTDGGVICVENGEEERCEKAKRKRKKKKNNVEQSGDEAGSRPAAAQSDCQPLTDAKVKKKKKSSLEDKASGHTEPEEAKVKQRRKKCKKDKTSGDSRVDEEEIPPQKKKKKKKGKDQPFI